MPRAIIPASVLANNEPKSLLISPKDVYAQYRQGTPAASRAFWVSPGKPRPRHQGADRSPMALGEWRHADGKRPGCPCVPEGGAMGRLSGDPLAHYASV